MVGGSSAKLKIGLCANGLYQLGGSLGYNRTFPVTFIDKIGYPIRILRYFSLSGRSFFERTLKALAILNNVDNFDSGWARGYVPGPSSVMHNSHF